MSLRKRATSGLFWSAVERFSQQACVFVVQVPLARLLAPEQFGLMAMVSVFVAISGAIVESGLGSALVQKQDADDRDRSTVFWFNLAAAGVMVGALWLFAPYVGRFYERSEIVSVLRALGIGLLIGAAGSVHASLLRRDLQFRKLLWVSTPSTLLSGCIGIAFAFQGFGVWSLVAQNLCQRVIGTAILWRQTGWHPGLCFNPGSLRRLLPYGSRLAVSGILDRAFQNLYVLVIGKAFSPVDVGFFHRALTLQQLPITSLHSVVGGVSFPVLSKLQGEPARMRRVLATSLHLTALLSFAGMAVFAATARPLVQVLLGEKWLPCVPMLQLLCVPGALYALHAGNLSLLQALGRSELFLRLEVIKKVMTVANIAVTWRYGITAMICGMMVTSLLALIVNTHYTRQFIGYGLGRQLRDVLPMIGLGAGLIVSIFGLSHFFPPSPWAQLFFSAAWASGVFLAALRFMPESVRYEICVVLHRSVVGRRMSLHLLGAPVRAGTAAKA